jgi:hypothetical protein
LVLVVILVTGAALSALYERGCQDTNTLTITAHQGGEIWLSVIADKDEMARVGEVKAGEPTDFDAPVGGVRVELRRGEEVLHTSFIQFALGLGFNRYWSSSPVAGREPVEAFVMSFT